MGATSEAGSIFSGLLICSGGMCIFYCLLWHRDNICIWHMIVFMSVVVTVWGSVGMFVVQYVNTVRGCICKRNTPEPVFFLFVKACVRVMRCCVCVCCM